MIRSNKPSVMFRLVCIRHGETDANKQGRLQGHIDVPLNETGLQQAKKAGMALRSEVWSRSYCSTLMRTEQTAQQVLAQSAMQSTPKLQPDERISERHFGRFENMMFRDVQKIMRDLNMSLFEYFPRDDEEGESGSQVQERFVNFFKRLCQSIYDKTPLEKSGSPPPVPDEVSSNSNGRGTASNGSPDEVFTAETVDQKSVSETVLLASHGEALRQFYMYLSKNLGCVFPSPVHVHPVNTAFSVFTVRYSPRKYDVVCHQFNNSDHLREASL